MAAPAGAVDVIAYQGEGNQPIGTASPAGNQGPATLQFTPQPGVPVVLQVVSYIPQTVNYQISQS
jgi:hypothetical protein